MCLKFSVELNIFFLKCPEKSSIQFFLSLTFFWKLSKSKQRRPFEGRLCIDLENLQQFSSDMGHMTRDVWHVTCDMLRRVNILSKLQLPSSYGVGRTVSWRYFNKSWPTEWMNGKAFLTQNMFLSLIWVQMIFTEDGFHPKLGFKKIVLREGSLKTLEFYLTKRG